MAGGFLVTFCCLLFVSLAYGLPTFNLTEDSHNIYQCPDPSIIADAPLCQLDIHESGKIFSIITKKVDCPQTGVNKDKIACIIVKDNVDNDAGGYASISTGGLNQYFVEINLKSQRGKGIDFHIEVYTQLAATTADAATTTDATTKA